MMIVKLFNNLFGECKMNGDNGSIIENKGLKSVSSGTSMPTLVQNRLTYKEGLQSCDVMVLRNEINFYKQLAYKYLLELHKANRGLIRYSRKKQKFSDTARACQEAYKKGIEIGRTL